MGFHILSGSSSSVPILTEPLPGSPWGSSPFVAGHLRSTSSSLLPLDMLWGCSGVQLAYWSCPPAWAPFSSLPSQGLPHQHPGVSLRRGQAAPRSPSFSAGARCRSGCPPESTHGSTEPTGLGHGCLGAPCRPSWCRAAAGHRGGAVVWLLARAIALEGKAQLPPGSLNSCFVASSARASVHRSPLRSGACGEHPRISFESASCQRASFLPAPLWGASLGLGSPHAQTLGSPEPAGGPGPAHLLPGETVDAG